MPGSVTPERAYEDAHRVLICAYFPGTFKTLEVYHSKKQAKLSAFMQPIHL